MVKLLGPEAITETPKERQAAAEKALKGVFNRLKLPEPQPAPADVPPDRREVWELKQEVKLLRDRYNLVVKIAWRTSAALVGLAAPAFGWDFISRVLDVLGVK